MWLLCFGLPLKIMQHVPVYYLGHLVEVLREHDFPIELWLLSKKIISDELYSVDTKLTAEQFDELLGLVLKQKQGQSLGLTIGRKLQIAHHGTFGLGLLNCETVEQMIEFVQQYLSIRIPFIEIATITANDNLIVLAKDTHWQGDLHRFVIEAVTGAMVNILKAIQQKVPDLTIDRLFFDYPAPHYREKYHFFSDIEIDFEHAYCGIAVNKANLSLPIPQVDKLSFMQAKQACQEELEKSQHSNTYKGKVQQCLMQTLKLGSNSKPDLNRVARQLNVSPRSLNRYLKKEGTSYRQLLDEHQSLLAKEALLSYGYSVTQTALNLGFMDVANFRRAFKRWYQCTPSAFVDKYKE